MFFDVMEKKSKHYYSLLIGKKAQLPSAASKLQMEFNFSIDQLKQIFKTFWVNFELFWFSGTQKTINRTQQDVIVGVLSCSCPLLNYLLLIAKIYLWECRRNQTLQNINGYKA